MSNADRFNRILAAMNGLFQDGLEPVLAVRYRGEIVKLQVNPVTGALQGEGSLHPREVLEDDLTQFVEGYPTRHVDRSLSDIW